MGEAHSYKPTPSPYKEEAPVKRLSDPVCGFAPTSNTSTSSAYKKDEEDEEKPVEEPTQPQKASGIALPITEMTDNWMDDGQALGSMDSEDEEDTKKSEEKTVEEPPKPEAATKSEEKPVEEPSKPQQASGIALPITEMTDDWMDDGQALGSMDSEDEEDAKKSEE